MTKMKTNPVVMTREKARSSINQEMFQMFWEYRRWGSSWCTRVMIMNLDIHITHNKLTHGLNNWLSKPHYKMVSEDYCIHISIWCRMVYRLSIDTFMMSVDEMAWRLGRRDDILQGWLVEHCTQWMNRMSGIHLYWPIGVIEQGPPSLVNNPTRTSFPR